MSQRERRIARAVGEGAAAAFAAKPLEKTMRVQLPNGAPGRISSKVEPAIDNREVLVRFQHPAPVFY